MATRHGMVFDEASRQWRRPETGLVGATATILSLSRLAALADESQRGPRAYANSYWRDIVERSNADLRNQKEFLAAAARAIENAEGFVEYGEVWPIKAFVARAALRWYWRQKRG